MTPRVSVITPTWQRHDSLLNRCIPSVQAQTYRDVEHVVVSDGPDPELASKTADAWLEAALREPIPVHMDSLPVHSYAVRWGHNARLRGIEMAQGDIIAWLDDDNAFRPDHLAKCVQALDESGAQFTYTQAAFHGRGTGGTWYVVGITPPSYAQIDTSMIVHRRELLDVATWRDEGQETVDWDLVHRWLQAGATWTWVPGITVDNYH